jgi:hypothetical protein
MMNAKDRGIDDAGDDAITIFALFGFDHHEHGEIDDDEEWRVPPPSSRHGDPQWLREHCDHYFAALTFEELPVADWMARGTWFIDHELEVAGDSEDAPWAVYNSHTIRSHAARLAACQTMVAAPLSTIEETWEAVANYAEFTVDTDSPEDRSLRRRTLEIVHNWLGSRLAPEPGEKVEPDPEQWRARVDADGTETQQAWLAWAYAVVFSELRMRSLHVGMFDSNDDGHWDQGAMTHYAMLWSHAGYTPSDWDLDWLLETSQRFGIPDRWPQQLVDLIDNRSLERR